VLVDALDALRPAKLRSLSLLTYAQPARLDAIASFGTLRRLAVKFFGDAPPGAALAAIARVAPALEALDLHVDGDDEQWSAIAPLFGRTDVTLRQLALRGEGLARPTMRALVDGPLAARIETLEIAAPPHAWVHAFLDHRERFAKLELLRLQFNGTHPSTFATLRGTIPRLVDYRTDPDRELAGEPVDEHYEEVRE
jgi:hypothetical protein